MLLDSWSVALLLCSVAILLLATAALPTAIRVLLRWQPGEDSEAQIRLEAATWLAALLIRYCLAFQIISVVLLVLAASSFAQVLPGAMCAAGAFLANPFGLSALLLKIVLVFICGLWLLLHALDIQSEDLPLVRGKFVLFIGIFPLLLADAFLLASYLLGLDPEVITSCCGVAFQPSGPGGYALLAGGEPVPSLFLFVALSLLWLSLTRLPLRSSGLGGGWGGMVVSLGLLTSGFAYLFYGLQLVTVTVSPYVYALPSHRCPFDLLQSEYGFYGVPLYVSLFFGAFAASGTGLCSLLSVFPGLANTEGPSRFARYLRRGWLLGGLLFLLFALYPPLAYLFLGGEGGVLFFFF